jgi:hypothetical protein
MMALSELTAFESAYGVLSKLDAPARRRALQWLSDALGDNRSLAMSNSTVNADRVAPAQVAAAQTAPRSRGRRPSTVKAEVRGGRKKAKASTDGRAYRRMPEPDAVLKVYQKVGTISALAEHFDVPVYTVHSWARRLRGQGYQIGRER